MNLYLVRYADTGKLLVPANRAQDAMELANQWLEPTWTQASSARLLSDEEVARQRRYGVQELTL